MDFIQQFSKEIVALLVPLITWLFNSPQRGEVRLVQAVRHAHTFRLTPPQQATQANVPAVPQQVPPQQQPQILVHTTSVVIHNLGKLRATNVEIVLNFPPRCINFWPARDKTIRIQEDNRYVVIFGTLAANEFVGFEMLTVDEALPSLVHVRCDQGAASAVSLVQRLALPQWRINMLRFFMFLGTGAAAYFVLVLLQFIVLKAP